LQSLFSKIDKNIAEAKHDIKYDIHAIKHEKLAKTITKFAK